MLKTGFSLLIKFFAALAAILLVVSVYIDCGGKCRHCQSECHRLTIEKNMHSACCRQDKEQQKNTNTRKCKGPCCITKLPPSATTENQIDDLVIQNSGGVYENISAVGPSAISKSVTLSSNPSFYPHNSKQAILCVFVI